MVESGKSQASAQTPMVAALLDTSIIVDLIRGYPDAYQWLQSSDETYGVSPFVWLEVVQGAPNKQKLKAALTLLADFERIPSSDVDVQWALESLVKVNLKHNVDAMDCLIAASAHRLQKTLFTRNLKHFQPLLGDLALSPY